MGGVTDKGLHKNIQDNYRYIVQNYAPGDKIWLFGFSRSAYTVRSLCGMINNCGILTRPDAALITAAFKLYKKPGARNAPKGENSVAFRQQHSHPSRQVAFVGVWDTVGAMGIPLSFLGLFDDKDEFYDTKLGRNVRVARHALAIDEQRSDFEPIIWQPKEGLDLKQQWFVGAHNDIGGSYKPDANGKLLADNALEWMVAEAASHGLSVEPHLPDNINNSATATLHRSRRSFYRVRKRFHRPIDHGEGEILIHPSVKQRWQQDDKYRPKNLQQYIQQHGWPDQ